MLQPDPISDIETGNPLSQNRLQPDPIYDIDTGNPLSQNMLQPDPIYGIQKHRKPIKSI
jgi:hypothetical protein